MPGEKYRSIKKPHAYEGLRSKGMSKERAAKISNSMSKAVDVDELFAKARELAYYEEPDDEDVEKFETETKRAAKHGAVGLGATEAGLGGLIGGIAGNKLGGPRMGAAMAARGASIGAARGAVYGGGIGAAVGAHKANKRIKRQGVLKP